MEHCAIDLGGRKSQVCVRDGSGQILYEARWDTAALPRYLQELPRCRVVLETCAEAFRIADAAKAAGHDVRVVPATLVRALGVGARRTKTDRRDAQALSEASCRMEQLPSVHVPSARSREWKSICGMHSALVGSRTKLINTLRGWLRGQGKKLRSGAAQTFAARLSELAPLPTHVEVQRRVVAELTRELEASTKRMAQLAQSDPTCSRLMTTPGIGPAVALRFVAALDEVGRFESAAKVAAYLGLTPGESSSSERQMRLGITKAGPSDVRWALVQAAWTLRFCTRRAEARPLQQWALEIEKRRGRQIAAVALARKLAGILYALWRDGTEYEQRG